MRDQVVTAEAGWYPYQGDPEGTVRRWTGREWIGFPTTLPSAQPGPLATDMAVASYEKRRPLPRPWRLSPFAFFGALGLIAPIILGIDLIRELVDIYKNMSNVSSGATVRALNDPMNYPTSRRFGIGVLGGGVLFLAWLWRAHRNLGRPVRWSQAGVKSWFYFGTVITVVRLIFSPIISMMFDLVENSGSGPDSGKIEPFGPILWWVLWLFSSYFIPLTLLFLWAENQVATTGFVGFVIGCLVAHVLSLVIALKLLIQITIYQERRLALSR